MKHIRKLRVQTNDRKMPPPYGRTSSVARLLYALTKYTRSSPKTIARCCRLEQAEVENLWKRMRKDENFKHIIKRGLPAMYGESLPEDHYVICIKCNRLINWVPCVECCNHTEVFVDRSDKIRNEKGEVVPPLPCEPTKFAPGSSQKVAVMKYRVEMGMQPFCDDDAKGMGHV